MFAFAALAAREFFTLDYFNRDYLRLIIQAFTDPQGGAVVGTRRRDGVTDSIHPGDVYRVQVPAHVTRPGLKIKPDWALLRALLASREREAWSGLYQGIVLFNQANTDAPDTAPETELVLTYAAIERILGLSKKRDQRSLSAKFADAWVPSRKVPRTEWRRPADGSPGKSGENLRAWWASDLKARRGSLAHGRHAVQAPGEWRVREHLLLTSFTVPRLVKQILSRLGLYELTKEDTRDIDTFESLLNLPDLFERVGDSRSTEQFAWQRVLPSSRSLEYVCEQLRAL